MNKKAQIATVVAVLLGVFLVVVTAIKFDWVGMVVRGDKIINFDNNNVTDKKPEENNSNNNNEETNEENNSNKEEIVNLVCSKISDTTDLQTYINYSYSFFNNELISSEANVVASYTLPETKASFDEFIKKYSDLVVMYNNNPTITANDGVETNNYTYYEKVNFESETFAEDAVGISFTKQSTVADVTSYYEGLGYQCTQS